MGYTEEIRLSAKDASLIIEVERHDCLDKNGHFIDTCIVYFISPIHDESIKVGCIALKKLEARFLEAFKLLIGPRKKFTWRGKTMFGVMSFMGPHATMAAEELDDGGLCINILDKNGDFLPSFDLTRDDMDRWLKVLEEYRLNHPWN